MIGQGGPPTPPKGGPGGLGGMDTMRGPAAPPSPVAPPSPTPPMGGPGGGIMDVQMGDPRGMSPEGPPQVQMGGPRGGGEFGLPQLDVTMGGPKELPQPAQPPPPPPKGGPGGPPPSEYMGGPMAPPPPPKGGPGGGTEVSPTGYPGGKPQGGPFEEDDPGDYTADKPIRDEIGEPSGPTTGGTQDLTPDLSGTDFSGLQGLSGNDIVFGGDPVFGSDTDWSGVLGDTLGPTGPTGGAAGGTTGGMISAPTGQSLLDATTGGDIASQFGFDPGQYGGYFAPVSEGMRTAATEEGYTGFLGEQRAQLRETGGQQRRGLRASLLQDVMTAQQQGGAAGFAGAGAQTQALGLARSGRQLGAEQLASQYGKGMHGVRQQIAGRVTAGEQALASAQKSMYDRALALQQSGATMGAGTGAGTGAGAGAGTGVDTTVTPPGGSQTDIDIMTDPSMPDPSGDYGSTMNDNFEDYAEGGTGPAYDAWLADQQQQGNTAQYGGQANSGLPAYATRFQPPGGINPAQQPPVRTEYGQPPVKNPYLQQQPPIIPETRRGIV